MKGSPRGISRRTISPPRAWKVLIHTSFEAGPTSWCSRSRISSEALLVNVTAAMARGGTPDRMSRSMRCVMTRVLPLPAPASTRAGPAPCSTAAFCAGLRGIPMVPRRRVAEAPPRVEFRAGTGVRVRAPHWRTRARRGSVAQPLWSRALCVGCARPRARRALLVKNRHLLLAALWVSAMGCGGSVVTGTEGDAAVTNDLPVTTDVPPGLDGGAPVDNGPPPPVDAGQPDTRVPRCGDGILDPGESCDDGNNTSGDMCTAMCRFEARCGDGMVQRDRRGVRRRQQLLRRRLPLGLRLQRDLRQQHRRHRRGRGVRRHARAAPPGAAPSPSAATAAWTWASSATTATPPAGTAAAPTAAASRCSA
jgi:cysteine-rich repeat protein